MPTPRTVTETLNLLWKTQASITYIESSQEARQTASWFPIGRASLAELFKLTL